MMLFLIPILFAVSVFLFALSLIPTKSVLSRQLEILQTREPGKAGNDLAGFERMFSSERRVTLTKQLASAGWYGVTPAKMGLRMIGSGCLGLIFAMLALRFIHFPSFVVIPAVIAFGAAGVYAPMTFLNRALESRKGQIQKALPDFLDMVSSTVQAGLAVNAALAYAVDVAPGALGDEIKEALSEIRLGRSRADALKAAANRADQQELKTAITAITQAERLGSNLGGVLNELAEDARNHRVMLTEEAAGKLPVKMVFPMVFCMLPSIFVVIFGTIVANYLATR